MHKTKVTSKYSVLAPKSSKVSKSQSKPSKRPAAPPASGDAPAAPANIATFTLKTYDPVSGTCLKYQTDKAAEVGRLVGGLGKLARYMAALPEIVEGKEIAATIVLNIVNLGLTVCLAGLSAPLDQGARAHTPVPEGAVAKDSKSAAGEAKGPQTGGAGGGGKKKKKGKK
jgi:hypothetical protein